MRLFKEPLIHFFILGAALFAVFSVLNGSENESPSDIIITKGQVQALAESFKVAKQRTPTEDEVAALVQEHIHEEVYVREALALGLDQNDLIIRRRLRQKMEFITEDLAALNEPTELELETYWSSHPEKYREDATYSFTQVYLNPIKHRDLLSNDIDVLLDKLKTQASHGNLDNAPAELLGDGLILPRRLESVSAAELDKIFGADFSSQLAEAPLNSWSGTYSSGYGKHVVFVDNRSLGSIKSLDSVKTLVARDWKNDNRLAANQAFYQALLARYQVVVE